jgi:DNA polymerase IIIc chi subunit
MKYPKIISSSQNEKKRVCNAFNASFVINLCKATDDADAQFLLGVYDAAQEDGDETAANNVWKNYFNKPPAF